MERLIRLQIEMEESCYDGLISMEPLFFIPVITQNSKTKPTFNTNRSNYRRHSIQLCGTPIQEKKFRGLLTTDSKTDLLVDVNAQSLLTNGLREPVVIVDDIGARSVTVVNDLTDSGKDSSDSARDSESIREGDNSKRKPKMKKSVSFDPLLDEVDNTSPRSDNQQMSMGASMDDIANNNDEVSVEMKDASNKQYELINGEVDKNRNDDGEIEGVTSYDGNSSLDEGKINEKVDFSRPVTRMRAERPKSAMCRGRSRRLSLDSRFSRKSSVPTNHTELPQHTSSPLPSGQLLMEYML